MAAKGSVPVWLDSDFRNLQYSQDTYYTGFAEISATKGEDQEKALSRAKQSAIGELSERIRVMVSSNKTSVDVGIGGSDIEEQIRSRFSSVVNTSSQTEVTGSKVSTYYDSNSQTAYAFAYVSKAELAGYYQKQISFWLNKVEGALQTAGELVEKGYKMKASRECENVVEAFAKVAYAQDLLTIMDKQEDDSILQQSRSERLRNTLTQTITDLESSIYIYVECREVVDGQPVAYIGDRLPGMITEKGCGCSFTDMPEEADYVIKVNAGLSRCSDAPDNIIYCYANATASVYNTRTQRTQMPKIAEAKGGWTGGNRGKAIEEAFNELTDKIVEKIALMIKA